MALPPFHDPEVLKLDVRTRAKLIYDYHVELNKQRHESQLKSHVYVPWGPPILSSDKFKGNLLKTEEIPAYSLRSQRLNNSSTKQNKAQTSNIYSDEDDVDASDDFNTTEKEHISSSKHSSSKEKNIPTSKQEKVHIEIKSSKKTKLTNSEIIKKSKLFNSPTNKRVELIMEQAVNDITIKKKEEEMALFEATLKDLSDDEKQSNENNCDNMQSCSPIRKSKRTRQQLREENKDEIVEQNEVSTTSETLTELFEDESQFRKRIPPPLHGRSKRIRNPHIDGSQPPVTKRNKYGRNDTINTNLENFADSTPSTSEQSVTVSENKQKVVACPLCNKAFPQNKIEVHAATCGLTQNNEISKNERIKCETCNNFFPLNTDFEVHVQECLAAAKKNCK